MIKNIINLNKMTQVDVPLIISRDAEIVFPINACEYKIVIKHLD